MKLLLAIELKENPSIAASFEISSSVDFLIKKFSTVLAILFSHVVDCYLHLCLFDEVSLNARSKMWLILLKTSWFSDTSCIERHLCSSERKSSTHLISFLTC